MEVTTTAVLTGAVVTAGRISQGKKISARVIVGAGILALVLSAINQGRPELASAFGMLILVGALLNYGVPLAQKLGFHR